MNGVCFNETDRRTDTTSILRQNLRRMSVHLKSTKLHYLAVHQAPIDDVCVTTGRQQLIHESAAYYVLTNSERWVSCDKIHV